jgi:hypothetical protein
MKRLGLIAALIAVLAQGLLGGLMPSARADRLALGAICGGGGQDQPLDSPAHEAFCRLCPVCAVPDGVGLLAAGVRIDDRITVTQMETPDGAALGVVVAPGGEGQPRAPPIHAHGLNSPSTLI